MMVTASEKACSQHRTGFFDGSNQWAGRCRVGAPLGRLLGPQQGRLSRTQHTLLGVRKLETKVWPIAEGCFDLRVMEDRAQGLIECQLFPKGFCALTRFLTGRTLIAEVGRHLCTHLVILKSAAPSPQHRRA